MAVQVVTDSTSDISPGEASELGVRVVPLLVAFGEEVFRDRVDISPSEFYDRLVSSPEFPKTSQPSVEDFATVYREVAGEGDDIASIHVSSKLSGTLNSASVASETSDLGTTRVELLDSYTAGVGLRAVVEAAAAHARKGAPLEEVTAVARSVMARSRVIVAVDTLEYLQKGGRLGRAAALVGGALRFKPILHLEGGEVAPLARVRSREKAIKRIEEEILEDLNMETLFLIYSDDDSGARDLIERISPRLPHTRIEVIQTGPTVGAYMGPKALGFCAVRRS
ncbi:MAG: hypothetical protein CL897_05655 [Dehalococcoidia bacterium]|nr:hypothetical protein [Dehalococcoidia bacterium]HCV00962.1 DegV family protein [Dehalococcoidia bacterium]|tara:strand:+ start:1247 stop:2089 length:843 start_codon:yes stop_codon:yes gene_type:complete